MTETKLFDLTETNLRLEMWRDPRDPLATALLVAALLLSPLLSATVNLAAGALALILLVSLAVIVAAWRRQPERAQ